MSKIIDQRACRFIKAIAEERSFSRAAEKLYISQPSLSRFVKNLENQLGVRLFDRNLIPLKLTPAGVIFIQYIDKFQILDKKMEQDLKKYNSNAGNTLIISTLPRLGIYLLPKIIPYFANTYSALDLNINEVSSNNGIDCLKEKSSDIFLTNLEVNDPAFISKVLCHDPIVLAANYTKSMQEFYPNNTSSPLKPYPVCWPLFQDMTFILLHPWQNMRIAANRIIRKNHLIPKKIIEVSSLPAGLSLVCANKGITFICNSAMSGVPLDSPLIYFSAGELQDITDIRALYRKDNTNQYIDLFCSMAAEKLK